MAGVPVENLEALRERYERELSDDPSSGAFVLLAEVLRRQDKLDKAVEILLKGLKSHPQNAAARLVLGGIYYDMWMIDAAKKEMEQALKIAPDSLPASRILVEIYRSEGKPERALEVASVALLFHPESVDVNAVISDLTREVESLKEKRSSAAQNNRRDALLSMSEDELASSLSTSDAEIYTETMADLYLAQGDYESAVGVLAKLVESRPEDGKLRLKLDLARACLLSERAGFRIK